MKTKTQILNISLSQYHHWYDYFDYKQLSIIINSQNTWWPVGRRPANG